MVMIPEGAKRVGDLPSGGETLPEGTYYLRSDKSELRTVSGAQSKNRGASMAAVMFTVFGPPEQEAFHGRKLFENFMLVGDGLFRARQFFEAAGEGEDFVIEDTDQFLNREVAAVVGVEPARVDSEDPTGKKMFPARNNVKRFLPIV